jgi:hypothetical protein
MFKKLLIFIIIIAAVVFIYESFRQHDDCTVLQTIRLNDADIKIVDDACKEGLPHTTNSRTIRMTRSIWEGPRREEILTHERVHLAQKSRSASEWKDFYEREWDYKCYATAPSSVPAELVARLRPNPDTSDSPWAVWRGRWLFFPAFGDEYSLRNAEVIVWDLENHHMTGVPEEWKQNFCENDKCPYQYEHPHEISAEWLTAKTHGEIPKTSAADKLFVWKK